MYIRWLTRVFYSYGVSFIVILKYDLLCHVTGKRLNENFYSQYRNPRCEQERRVIEKRVAHISGRTIITHMHSDRILLVPQTQRKTAATACQ